MAQAPLGGGGGSPFSLGTGSLLGGAAGLAGLGYTLAQGESPLPSEYQVVTNTYAPTEFAQGQAEFGQGQVLAGQGTQALRMAQAGQLTAPQAAALGQYQTSLSNQAAQMYYGMGRSPTKDTSYISQQADIDAKVSAMAQQFIQTTIALGGAELSAGGSLMAGGGQLEGAATTAMLTAGQAQFQDDQDYATAVSNAFAATAKGFGGGGTTINVGSGGSSLASLASLASVAAL